MPPLRAAGVEGEILPWREILHDGPVPDLDPEALRAVRAEFLGDRLNDRGLAILAGAEEWQPDEERWLGGTRIPPGRSPWHWDSETWHVRENS